MNNTLQRNFLNNLFFTPATLCGWGRQTQENISDSCKIYNNVTRKIFDNKTINKDNEKGIGVERGNRTKNAKQFVKSAIKTANIINVLGYIPLVGRLIGAVRILATIATPLDRRQRTAHIIRGISEVTGYNKIRLVIDIAATAFSFAKSALNNNTSFSAVV